MLSARQLGATALALVGLLTSCRDRHLTQLERVHEEVCRCQDAACVHAALARMPAAGPRNRRAGQRLAAEILRCVARVGESPPPPETGGAQAEAGAGAQAEAGAGAQAGAEAEAASGTLPSAKRP